MTQHGGRPFYLRRI